MKFLHDLIITTHRKFLTLGGRLGGGFLLLLLLLASVVTQAQTSIGGSATPLLYSVHCYKITMGNALNTTEWGIYEHISIHNQTTARDSVEHHSHRYTAPTDFKIDLTKSGKAAGFDSITIGFTGTLVVGQTYTLVYKETSSAECYIYEYFDFTLQEAIDIDLDPDGNVRNALNCPDSSLVYVEGNGTFTVPSTRTTIRYAVEITNPDGVDTTYTPAIIPASKGVWSFNYQISVTGQSGPSATIAEINFDPPWITIPVGASVYNGSATVSNGIPNYAMLITFNDAPSVEQKIVINLTTLRGSFQEIDIDEKNGTTSGQNELTHIINDMPAPSYIAALD
jgi:hypothetical protein